MAFIPVITAIVVGARLTGSVRRAPRPPGGHVIVVGLGNVGTSVTGQLHDLGFDVVCVDHNPAAAGIPMARQLGLPVVVGDAFREETLHAASLETCLALVSVTSSDIVNLETALTARALREDLQSYSGWPTTIWPNESRKPLATSSPAAFPTWPPRPSPPPCWNIRCCGPSPSTGTCC